MNLRPLLARITLACVLFFSASLAHAQDAQTELKALFEQIQAKLKDGKKSATDLAPEMTAFDKLFDKYKDKKDDAAAEIGYMRAMLYIQVLEQTDKGKAMLVQIKADFPGTKVATAVDKMLDRERSEAFSASLGRVQETQPEVRAILTQLQAKVQEGKRSAADLAPEMAALDKLVEKSKSTKDAAAAEIAYLRAMLYGQLLDQPDKAKAMFVQIKADFAGSNAASAADQALATIEEGERAEAAKAALIGKPAPELHFKWSTRKDLKKLSDLKGKVVVLDFWATWCGPCLALFPSVRELVEHYKDSDVVVLGVTSIQGQIANLEPQPIDTEGKPEKEFELMPKFMKAMGMTWPVAISDEEVFNPDYAVSGIPHITIVAPDGTIRHNGIHPATPENEKLGYIDAILKEFKLKVPAAAVAPAR